MNSITVIKLRKYVFMNKKKNKIKYNYEFTATHNKHK